MGKSFKSKFISAKININRNIFSHDKEMLVNLIPEAILLRPSMKRNSWNWKIAEAKEIRDESTLFIFGHLVKSRLETVTIVNGDKIETYNIPKPVANVSRFIYDPQSEVLIFEEVGNIPREDFIRSFEELIFKAKIEIGEVIIKLIPIKDKIYKRITEMDVLTKIEFDFIPPNFHGKDTFKSLDDIIQEENATRMKASFENNDGLNKSGFFIKEGVEKVSNAYGDVKAYGYNNLPSRSKRYKTKRSKTSFNSKDLVHMKSFKVETNDELLTKIKKFALEMRNIIL